MLEKKKVLILVGVVLLLVTGIGFWLWQNNKQAQPASPTKETLAPTLGGQISEKLQNPIGGKIPNTNPFKDQKNPFDVIYQNPFK